MAIRKGELYDNKAQFNLQASPLKSLLSGKIKLEELQESDFNLEVAQKGVDMRIGLDIAAIAERRLANQIVMISGDSDFVPAAKHARRCGLGQ